MVIIRENATKFHEVKAKGLAICSIQLCFVLYFLLIKKILLQPLQVSKATNLDVEGTVWNSYLLSTYLPRTMESNFHLIFLSTL